MRVLQRLLLKYPNIFTFLFFLLVVAILFWPFLLLNKIPIPADALLGTYYPWFDDSWGGMSRMPVKNPLMSDIVSQLYPWRLLVVEYFKQGYLPLWDPTAMLGTSLIGNFQTGIFNPTNLLYLLPLSFNTVWGVQVFIQPLLGMFTMSLFLKRLKLSTIAVIFGSISYGLSGPLLIWMEYNVHSFVIATLPLLLYFVDKFLEKKEIRFLVFISLVIGLMLSFGYPQHVYYAVAASFGYLLFNSLNEKILLIKSLLGVFIAIIFGITLAGVQILPGAENVFNSIRNVDTAASTHHQIYLPPEHLLTAISPDFFGNPTTYNYWSTGTYESFAFYTSIVGLVLIFGTIFLKSQVAKSKRITLWIFLIGSALFALPPLAYIFQQLTFLGLKGSVAPRILYIYSFALSALAAIAMDKLIGLQKSVSFKKILISFCLPLVFVILPFVLYLIFNNEVFKLHPEYLKTALRNSAIPFGLVGLTIFTIVTYQKLRFKFLLVFLILFLIGDMYRFGWKYLPFTDSNLVFPETSSLNYLQENRGDYRIAIEKAELLTSNTWAPYGLESISGYDVLVPLRTSQYIQFLNNQKLDINQSRFLGVDDFNSPLLNLASVKYIVSLKRLEGVPNSDGILADKFNNSGFKEIFNEGPVTVLENPNVVPRIYSPTRSFIIQNQEEQLKFLMSSDFKIGQDVVLEKEVGDLSQCNFNYTKPNKQSYNIESDCKGDGLLVISDSYNNGWQGKVNGNETEILRVNNNFVGIKVPAGKSVVDVFYLPKSFINGAMLSFGTFILLALIGIWSFKKRVKI